MAKNTYDVLAKQMLQVMDNDINDTTEQFMYILNPYVSSLGYNIYDMAVTKSVPKEGYITCKVLPNVTIIFTIKDQLFNEEDDKILVYINTETMVLYLKFNVLNEWRLAYSVELSTSDAKGKFNALNRYTDNSALKANLDKYGEKFLYDAIVSYELNNKNLNNAFVKDVIGHEIKHPDPRFVQVLADDLAKKYSLSSKEDIFKVLTYLMKQSGGLSSLISLNDDILQSSEGALGLNVETAEQKMDKNLKTDGNNYVNIEATESEPGEPKGKDAVNEDDIFNESMAQKQRLKAKEREDITNEDLNLDVDDNGYADLNGLFD